jgi:hypothetical protein
VAAEAVFGVFTAADSGEKGAPYRSKGLDGGISPPLAECAQGGAGSLRLSRSIRVAIPAAPHAQRATLRRLAIRSAG